MKNSPTPNDGLKRIMQVTVLTGNTKAVPKNDKKIEDADHTDRVAPLLPNSNTDRLVQSTLDISNSDTLDISKLSGLFFTSSNYPKCKLICTSGNLDL